MADPARVALHRSIFARLVAVMLFMAVSLLAMVAGFFLWIVRPVVSEHHGRSLGELTRVLASTGLTAEEARGLARRLDLSIRYEGPRGTWTTSEQLPSIAEARAAGRRNHAILTAGDGGAYLFAFHFVRPLEDAHDKLVILLLLLILFVIVAGHWLLGRALRPLRTLQSGVLRMSEGDLEVEVPVRSRDELGVLTLAFNEMARRVRERVRARDQLLLDVSHELRSPLTRMRVALALLPPGEKAERLLADVVEMESLVTGLLELERLRDGRALERAPLDLAPLVREVCQAFPGVRLSLEPGALGIQGDGAKLRIALRNLVENAHKYSLAESGPVEVGVRRGEGAIVIEVTDDGPGIPAADLPRLFEPFFRVDPSRSKKTGGYGLGLSICQRIVQAHGGTVEARNNAGRRGATFRVTLPDR